MELQREKTAGIYKEDTIFGKPTGMPYFNFIEDKKHFFKISVLIDGLWDETKIMPLEYKFVK